MSYIIKGKDMPINCSECPCISSNFMFCRAAAKPVPVIGHPEFCSLVEIPDPKIFAARMELAKCYYHPEDNEYQALRDRLDPEMSHIRADELMCELLETLGYGEAVKIFEEMEKWYS